MRDRCNITVRSRRREEGEGEKGEGCTIVFACSMYINELAT